MLGVHRLSELEKSLEKEAKIAVLPQSFCLYALCRVLKTFFLRISIVYILEQLSRNFV